MKVIYLGAFQANHPNFDVLYQDINGKRDIGGCMLKTNLEKFDVIVATPPCNYWSIANQRRETSSYALKTKHLLPEIIKKLITIDKPFIVENVKHANLYKKHGLYDLPVHLYEIGRHTYWTNIMFNGSTIPQENDLKYKVYSNGERNIYISKKHRQGGKNVHDVIDYWLKIVNEYY